MKKEIISILALVLCAVVCVIPSISDECDAERYSVQFHDEFHGDFWMHTDDYGLLSYEQLQDPRLVPSVEGYEFKGWFFKDGSQVGLAMKFTSHTYVIAHYEKIGGDDSSNVYTVVILVVFLIVLFCAFFYIMRRKNRGS